MHSVAIKMNTVNEQYQMNSDSINNAKNKGEDKVILYINMGYSFFTLNML